MYVSKIYEKYILGLALLLGYIVENDFALKNSFSSVQNSGGCLLGLVGIFFVRLFVTFGSPFLLTQCIFLKLPEIVEAHIL